MEWDVLLKNFYETPYIHMACTRSRNNEMPMEKLDSACSASLASTYVNLYF